MLYHQEQFLLHVPHQGYVSQAFVMGLVAEPLTPFPAKAYHFNSLGDVRVYLNNNLTQFSTIKVYKIEQVAHQMTDQYARLGGRDEELII